MLEDDKYIIRNKDDQEDESEEDDLVEIEKGV